MVIASATVIVIVSTVLGRRGDPEKSNFILDLKFLEVFFDL